jgi:iron only hydrogenase large subunit-like protein
MLAVLSRSHSAAVVQCVVDDVVDASESSQKRVGAQLCTEAVMEPAFMVLQDCRCLEGCT